VETKADKNLSKPLTIKKLSNINVINKIQDDFLLNVGKRKSISNIEINFNDDGQIKEKFK